MSDIAANIKNIRDRVSSSCARAGRDCRSVKIIAVTKTASIEQIKDAVSEGINDFGENRVQQAVNKIDSLKDFNIRWHMIGHLQSNKVKQSLELFHLIHSLDSISLAGEIDKRAKEKGLLINALIEVNVSGEAAKYGVKINDVSKLHSQIKEFESLKVIGLMTMPPFSVNAQDSRIYFRKLKEIADEEKLEQLSMGTSQDFEVAIEEGATIIRIGREIFNK